MAQWAQNEALRKWSCTIVGNLSHFLLRWAKVWGRATILSDTLRATILVQQANPPPPIPPDLYAILTESTLSFSLRAIPRQSVNEKKVELDDFVWSASASGPNHLRIFFIGNDTISTPMQTQNGHTGCSRADTNMTKICRTARKNLSQLLCDLSENQKTVSNPKFLKETPGLEHPCFIYFRFEIPLQ